MEFILLVLGVIAWAVIKALLQPPPKPPPPRQRPLRPKLEDMGNLTPEPAVNLSRQLPPVFVADQPAPAEIACEDSFEAPAWLSQDALLQGIILSEVLKPPRARRTHRVNR